MSFTENLKLVASKIAGISSERLIENGNDCISVAESKSGSPTLFIKAGEMKTYLHSKYDPVHEAEQFVQKYSNAGKYQQVLFYGAGLGYHMKAFFETYGEKRFSIYEPNIEVLAAFLKHVPIGQLPLNLLHRIYVGTDEFSQMNHIYEIAGNADGEMLIVIHPAYEKIWAEACAQFQKKLQGALQEVKISILTNLQYRKLWIRNSLINVPLTMHCPHVLDKAHLLRGKPAIIAAAGPSLDEEIHQLKYIKKNGLAFIFSVGSATRALLANGIEPDAACTYDPQAHNWKVLFDHTNNGMFQVPVIYGTSVDWQTVDRHRGPKMHLITNKDTVTSFYLKRRDGKPLHKVLDAATISSVILQSLCEIGSNPIILVGQNLAFKGKHYYSGSVIYPFRTSEMTQAEARNMVVVKDVYGNDIPTNRNFLSMIEEMKWIVRKYSHANVINTTKGGAHIPGTTFQTLDEVTATLRERVVPDNWFAVDDSPYDAEYAKRQTRVMENELAKVNARIAHIMGLADEGKKRPGKNILLTLVSAFNELIQTDVFQVFLLPLDQVYYETMVRRIRKIDQEDSLTVKSVEVSKEIGAFMERCIQHIAWLTPLVREAHRTINETEGRRVQK